MTGHPPKEITEAIGILVSAAAEALSSLKEVLAKSRPRAPRSGVVLARRNLIALRRAARLLAKEHKLPLDMEDAGLFAVEDLFLPESKAIVLRELAAGASVERMARDLCYPPTNLRRLLRAWGRKQPRRRKPPDRTRRKVGSPPQARLLRRLLRKLAGGVVDAKLLFADPDRPSRNEVFTLLEHFHRQKRLELIEISGILGKERLWLHRLCIAMGLKTLQL